MRSRFLKIRQNYACHEGNDGLSNLLSPAGAEEREAARSGKTLIVLLIMLAADPAFAQRDLSGEWSARADQPTSGSRRNSIRSPRRRSPTSCSVKPCIAV
jgi:hypothetical protein